MSEQQEQEQGRLDKTENDQPQAPDPSQDAAGRVYASPPATVRPCSRIPGRPHWHVDVGEFDVEFATEAEAVAEAARINAERLDLDEVRNEMRDLQYAAAQSFFAWEASLDMRCPHCGAPMNATDSRTGASVPAVDRSRSSPDTTPDAAH